MTGRYNVRSGVMPAVFLPDHIGGLPHSEVTLAGHLKQAGYRSALVGKWHLGSGIDDEYMPTTHGFDVYYGVPHHLCPCSVCFYPNISCYDNCLPQYVSCAIYNNSRIIQQPADLVTLTDKYTQAGVEFINENVETETPFLLIMSYHQTHFPQIAGKNFYGKSHRGTFGDALMEMDNSVGDIVRVLDENHLLDDTFIWFTSDNG